MANFFPSFKGVPLVRATYQKGAGLPQYQGLIAVAFFKWTNGSEVMDDFLTWYSFVCNLSIRFLLNLIFSESGVPLVINHSAKKF